ncbi:hypothetical protein AAFF_G00067430 [Aldrovandia affinis]|uniref:Hypermethylated in cancer 1 protein n=1 Tax=Aldrovandia affinis TaxID=143900 RepID=A0AAD7T4N1_9TELE|nr:hypothetical protein AAFF_G00067430 [Aldrovandia affinis]
MRIVERWWHTGFDESRPAGPSVKGSGAGLALGAAPIPVFVCGFPSQGMKVEMELPNHAKQLLLQLNQQRAKGFLCDVIIVVENALFRAHKNVLAASSIYFKSLVLHDNLINLDTEMVNPSVFRQILDYIYTGKLLSSDQTSDQNFTALLTAASYLQLHDLAALCRKKLKRNGRTLPGKPSSSPALSRPLRAQRLSSTPAGQKHFPPGSTDCKKKPPDELLKDRLNGTLSSGSGGEAELGLDLSKKSPGDSTATEEVSPPHAQGSPPSAPASTANSASFEEPAAPNPLEGEPMDVGGRGPGGGGGGPATAPSHPGRGPAAEELPAGGPQEGVAQEGGRRDGRGTAGGQRRDRGAEGGRAAVQQQWGGGGGGSGSSFTSDHSFQCKEEDEDAAENGQEHSEDSDPEGPTANYVYRQEGFQPAFGDNLYVCIPCGKGFPSSEQLNAHVETHTEEELFIKEEEEEEEAEDLSASMATAPFGAESRPFKCSVCSKSYKDPATLRQHEKTHWLTRPFPCSICGKMFTQRGTMTRHMRSHLGLKPFACEECGMRFTRQYRLTEHMRVHSGEKPYECQLCGGKFTQQRNLISHLRMHTSPS